jgi:predicted nucleotidyltransferase
MSGISAHLAAEPIVALVALRGRLVERLDGELVFWPELAAAWLFGSAARGDGGTDSDIDMLVVAESTTDRVDWIDAGAQLRERVRSWTGNELQLVEHTRTSFAALVASENPLIAELRRDGIPLTPQSRRFLARAS